MDEFGVLVESIGFRAHGNSAPIGKLKPKPNTKTSSFNEFDSSSLPVNELDGVFRSNFNISNVDRPSVNTFGGDDIIDGPPVNQFGGVDLESVFNRSNDWINNSNLNSAASYGNDDLLGLNSKPSDGVDDLIPGFGGGPRHANNIVDSEITLSSESNGCSSNTSSPVTNDPFLVFDSSVSQSEQDIGKHSVQSSIDGFDVFATGGVHSDVKVDGIRTTDNNPNSGRDSYGFENLNDLDAILGGDNFVQQNPRPSSMNQGSLFGDFFHEEQQPKVKQSSPNVGGDFISLFEDVSTSSREFHEVDGEPKERREARLKHFINVNERMAEAVAQMNERDLRIEREQEEKHRLADTLDDDIKRWAAGKEGNLRALLSSLHQILWPECRWHPASLTDLITSESVKKVYMKANICVHPDKVQQRGANLQQKYLAEKIFDILMEAWNKFRAEEL